MFGSRQVAFDRVCRVAGDACNFLYAEILHIEEGDTGSFCFFQLTECIVNIHFLSDVVLQRMVLSIYALCRQLYGFFLTAN